MKFFLHDTSIFFIALENSFFARKDKCQRLEHFVKNVPHLSDQSLRGHHKELMSSHGIIMK